MSSNIKIIVHKVSELLASSNQMLVVAESCTGGWLAKTCTDLSGSSGWFDRGFVTYSNDAKQDVLGVRNVTIETYGAVSSHVVKEMVAGALAHSRAGWSVAISGIAGPDGGSEETPVGSVWFAWMEKNQIATVRKRFFLGDRDKVRQQSVEFALEELHKLLR